MRVEASGYQFVFPQMCVCCGSHPDTALTVSASKTSGKKVKRTQTNTWDFPYCSRCIKHKDAATFAAIAAVIVAVLALFVFAQIHIIVGLILGGGGAVGLYIWLLNKAKGQCSEHCVCVGKAVGFVSWDGTRQIFEIVSPKYASEFMLANQRKLINLSPQARTLIEGEGYMHRAKNVQSGRRHRK
jgi:hypothetical protein